MADQNHDEAIQLFQTVTGADPATAEHVLDAHAWNLDRGIGYFMEHGSTLISGTTAVNARPLQENDEYEEAHQEIQARGKSPSGRSGRARPASTRVARSHPVDLDDDEDDDGDYVPPHRETARHVDYSVLQEESARRRSPRHAKKAEGRQNRTAVNGMEDEDEDFAIMDAEPVTRQGGRVQRGRGESHQPDLQYEDDEDADLANGAEHEEADGHAQGLWPGYGHMDLPVAGRRGAHRGLSDAMKTVNSLGFAMPSAQHHGNGLDSDLLPAGIDIEEARMLEAAIMGIPYEGRVPDFAAEARQPEDPHVIEQRLLREEQDQAYQDSLRADQEKRSAAEAAERAIQEAEAKAAEEKRSLEQAQRDYEQDIENKLLGLPEEPAGSTEGAFTVLVRTPKGGRFGRRFLISHTIGDLFDFVDVNGAPDYKPGTYRLVTQFPRKTLGSDLQLTMAEAGLTQKQEALFLETL